MAVDWNIVGIAAGTAFCGMLTALFFGHPLLRAASEIRSLPKMVQGALAALALMATVNGQKLRSGGGGLPEPPAAVTQEDIARGYRLVAETNETGHSFSMPSNAAYVGRLHEHGARSDFGMHMVDFGAWAFPCGTNGGLRSRLWWFMDGRLQDAPRNPGFAASAGLGDTLAMQGESRLWLLADGDGRTVTWERFFACGDTNRAVNAQISLCGDGGFTVRSNDLVRVYRRVNPDDWDDDGIPNDDDIQPLAYDGDNFGPHQTLPEGANTNAYCWVDLVVPDANALVTFTGDGYSALPDPTFVARAGDTNRVILLIGKTYQVTSRMPIFCIGQSSGEIEVDQVSATELSICWPVTIEVESVECRVEGVELRNHLPMIEDKQFRNSTLSTFGSQFTMSVWPDWLGGGFTWTNGCCAVVPLGGGVFSYSCNDACHCGGCCAMGYYGYESYRLPAYGGWCGCNGEYDPRPEEGDDDEPHDAGASATFSKCAVIFEDGYWNTPTNWVERQSSQTELHCVAHGGPNGGRVRFEISGEDKLKRVSGHLLPVEQDVEAGKKLDFTIVYKGQLPSASANDIIVTTTFSENVVGATQEVATTTLTSVRAELTPIDLPPENQSPHRHVLGIAEKVNYRFFPNVSGPELHDGTDGDMLLQIDDVGRCFYAPWTGGVYAVSIVMADANHDTFINVVEPSVECRNVRRNVEIPSFSGEAGWIGMKFDLYLQPRTVSFEWILMEEIPVSEECAIPASGYFAMTNILPAVHNSDAGAGKWSQPRLNDGSWTHDKAQMPHGCPPVDGSVAWPPGRLTWDIPIGWGDALHTLKGRIRPNPTQQIYEIQSDGTLSVSKFGHVIERQTNNCVRLSWQ